MADSEHNLVGRTITAVREVRASTIDDWFDGYMVVIDLDDGSLLFAQQDDEGNGPGVLINIHGSEFHYV